MATAPSVEMSSSEESVVSSASEPAPSGRVIHSTPSGMEVLYQWEPKRLYMLRGPHTTWDGEGHRENWTAEEMDWLEVPSVTTVLDCLNKPALPWWGMQVGIDGVVELVKLGVVRLGYNEQLGMIAPYMLVGPQWVPATRDDIEKLLILNHLTVNHVRDTAGDRGQAAHDAMEEWATNGTMPDPGIYPAEQQGYLEGLRKFLTDFNATPEAHEISVGSLAHKYAGRYDLRASTDGERRVVGRKTPKQVRYTRVPAGKFLLDLKTSKRIYQAHNMQLEAYEGASIECGYEPTDYRAVIHVTADGWYELQPTRAKQSDFLSVLNTYNVLEGLKHRE